MCLFCSIVSGKIPSFKFFENDKVLVFLDIAPVNYGHSLVIPKVHYKNLEDIPEDVLCELACAVKRVGRILKDGLSVPGYNVLMNNDSVSGQIVPHIHFHVIPRETGDGLRAWKQGEYKDGEALDIIEKLKRVIK